MDIAAFLGALPDLGVAASSIVLLLLMQRNLAAERLQFSQERTAYRKEAREDQADLKADLKEARQECRDLERDLDAQRGRSRSSLPSWDTPTSPWIGQQGS